MTRWTPIERGQVWDINLDPTVGTEIQKTRPCIVASSDFIGTLPLRVVVPITEWKSRYAKHPWMVKLTPNASNGLVKACAADALQIRSLDERRFVRCRGVLSAEEMDDVVAAIIIVLNIPIGSPGS